MKALFVRTQLLTMPALIASSGDLQPPPTAQEPWIATKGGSYNSPLAAELVWGQALVPARRKDTDIGFRRAEDAN